MKFSIVIPFYNEEKNLEILIPQLIKYLKKIKKYKFEVILVDDCSTDKSNYVAKIKSKNSKLINFKIIKLSKRCGQTGAFKKAFKKAKGNFIIRMDADLQDNPRDIIKFIKKIELGHDLVIKKRRFTRDHSNLLSISSSIYNTIMRLSLETNIGTFTSSFVAFNKKYLKKLPWYMNDHRYLPAIVTKRGVSNAAEVILDHKNRKFGSSRYNTFKKILFGIPEILLFLLRLNLGFYSIK